MKIVHQVQQKPFANNKNKLSKSTVSSRPKKYEKQLLNLNISLLNQLSAILPSCNEKTGTPPIYY